MAALVLVVLVSLVLSNRRGGGQAGDEVPSNTQLEVADEASAVSAKLVGRQVCRECHAENFALHANHGHASTFHFVPDTDLGNRLAGKSFDAGEVFGKYEYDSDDRGRLIARLRSQFGEEPFPLQYALGSGLNAQTMLTLVPGADGQTAGIEHRVTCYFNSSSGSNGESDSGRLGLTPGHTEKTPGQPLELFGAAHSGEPLARCIYCHTTTARIAQEEIVDLIPSINCEKCHGPGSEHVRLARGNSLPPPYSVGSSNWDVESELQLCGDCHRMPRTMSEDDLREYPDLLTRFQPIGLLRSRCYLESDRQLKCTTCHNPHATINATSSAQHVQNCLQCHQPDHSDQVACPVSSSEGCVECHMPSVELDQGLRFHDHWIRVNRE